MRQNVVTNCGINIRVEEKEEASCNLFLARLQSQRKEREKFASSHEAACLTCTFAISKRESLEPN